MPASRWGGGGGGDDLSAVSKHAGTPSRPPASTFAMALRNIAQLTERTLSPAKARQLKDEHLSCPALSSQAHCHLSVFLSATLGVAV